MGVRETAAKYLARIGAKRTETGTLPEDWKVMPFAQAVSSYIDYRGRTPRKLGMSWGGGDILALSANNVEMGRINPEKEAYSGSEQLYRRWMNQGECEIGDVVLTTEAPLGNVAQIPDSNKYILSQRVLLIKPREGVLRGFLAHYMRGSGFQQQLSVNATGSTAKGIQRRKLDDLSIGIPASKAEQAAIAGALGDADALIESTEQLLAKKRQIKQGAMQHLLTAKTRLDGFSERWQEKRIAEIASPTSEKNSMRQPLPVLTCSKHLGFVDSLRYFKNQVFSSDTSTYKLIRRGQIGYPSNHIEEGSIGLQDLYDVALVSPIYVVFSVSESTNSHFLHRLLKLESYRQEFETATTASVDRRGSLRWPAFSQITVSVPGRLEQDAISAALIDMEAEISAMERALEKARAIKQGMADELLAGRIRLI